MKRILPLLFGTLPCFAGQVAALPHASGVEKALEPFTMAIAGTILVLLGLAGRKRTV